jgi:probable HAF family extracellular repeat protein
MMRAAQRGRVVGLSTSALALSLGAGLAASAPALADAGFTPLGSLGSGTNFFSEAYGLTPDGRTIVGATQLDANSSVAFKWTALTGLVSQGDLSGGSVRSIAYGITPDASTICGEGNSAAGAEAFKKTGSTFTALGGTVTGGFFGSSANAISSDGSIIVGSRELAGFVIEACYWDATGIHGMGILDPTGFLSWCNGVSGDGSVIVGQTDANGGATAFRYTAAGGMVSLGTLGGTGVPNSEAHAISRDGNVIVGYSNSALGTEAFRWTQFDGMVSLGDLDGGNVLSIARGVSHDGRVIVGRARGFQSFNVPFIWDDLRGLRSLTGLMAAQGFSAPPGWQLGVAMAVEKVAADQSWVVIGNGKNPAGRSEAWRVELRQLCAADYNADGFVTLDDLGDFITDYYTVPAIPGGDQPSAPQYPDFAVGYASICPNAPDAPWPYEPDAYRKHGYRVGYSLDGSNNCPLAPEQTFPSLDNLGDYITLYYTPGGC